MPKNVCKICENGDGRKLIIVLKRSKNCSNTFDLMMIFFEGFFNIEIEFTNEINLKLGVIVISFLFLVLTIYLIFRAIGGDD